MTDEPNPETPDGANHSGITPSELEWTGERFSPGLKGQIAAEHLHRYAFACLFAEDKDVLDIACGEGYGASLLARTARSVVGVDIDAACVFHAQMKYGRDHLRFMTGSCGSIPLDDASIDLVVSLETIEHIDGHERFFDEIRRVLRPGGILIVSTPEKKNYNETTKTENPFHVKELSQEEFKNLVRRRFAYSQFMGQRFSSNSILSPEDDADKCEWFFFSGDYKDVRFSKTLPMPVYILAVCGDHPLPLQRPGFFELKEANIARPTKGADRETVVCVRVYAESGSGFSEAQAVAKYLPFETLQTVRFENIEKLSSDGEMRLRIDPCDFPSVITVTRLRIISQAVPERIIYGNSEADLRRIEFVSCLPAYGIGEGFVVVSPSDDPQMRLPALAELPEGGCALEITLMVEIEAEAMANALNGLRLSIHAVEEVKRLEAIRAAKRLEAIADAKRERALADLTNKSNELKSIRNSLCWKITAPLRHADEFVSKLRRPWKKRSDDDPPAVEMDEERLREARAEFKRKFREKREQELADFLKNSKHLEAPASDQPKVSIIIVLFNQAAFTLPCLSALVDQHEVSCEIIIVDNQSTDRTGELLQRVKNATILRPQENIGFLRAVNLGAKQARGAHLLLLNNDAVARPGSLGAAVQTLESAGDIGAVGGLLILPDGSVQEAGSIVWNDGSCLGYGRGLKPDDSEVMYRRDVDYCSGAFLLVRRDAFERLGGFDERFAPAYYEETDLCMRLWESGLRVVYEPRAVVDHFEFASATRPEDAISMQVRNQMRFRDKHARALEGRQPPGLEYVLRARQRDSRKGRLLLIDDLVPLPERGSGFPRAREIVNALSDDGYFVTLWPVRAPRENLELAYNVLRREIEIVNGIHAGKLKEFFEERQGYYNIILVSRPHNMEDVSRLFGEAPSLFKGARIIYDAEAVSAVREIEKARILGAPVEAADAEKMMKVEIGYARPADTVIVVSRTEAQHFLSAGYPRVDVIGHSLVPKRTVSGHGKREGFLFVGRLLEADSPNANSILWFVSEIFPKIQKALGAEAELFVAGLIGPAVAELLERPGVTVLGKVDDLSEFYGNCRVFVAPTRFSSGIPLKVLEAAAHGLPVVVTDLLAGQLEWKNGEDLLVASTADEFCQNCVRLYRDELLWNKLRDNALSRIAAECDPREFRRRLLRLINASSAESDC